MRLGYRKGDGPLHRTHPTTALAVLVAVGTAVFTAPGLWGLAALAAAIGLVVFERQPGVLRDSLVLATPFWAFLLLIHGVLGDDFERGVRMAGRITTMLVMFVLFLASVHPGRIVEALVEKKVPFSVAFLFAAALQAVPDLRERAAAVLEAQRCRGVRFGGSILNRIRTTLPLTVPMVIGALTSLDEKAIALETRAAVSGAVRTPINPPVDGTVGKIVRRICVAASVGLVVWRLWP